MRTLCKSCGADIETPPARVGFATRCPECGERMIPKVPEDSLEPLAGGISLHKFRELLSQPQSQPSLLVREWFGYELAWMGHEVWKGAGHYQGGST